MNKKNQDVWKQWSNYKRYLEHCQSDRCYSETLESYGLMLGDEYYSNLKNRLIGSVHAVLIRRHDPDTFTDQNFKTWFIRQRKRVFFESSIIRNKLKIFHVPISFELTKGCSGRCAFCSLDPAGLTECFYYTSENAELWKNILAITKKRIGNIAGNGVCYFATEPFDNPDYEKFIVDFYTIFGYYPQTTTVKAVDNIERTKALLTMLGDEHLQYAAVRFSVISKSQLEKIHQAFSPEELACVELLLNNPESINNYSLSGRSFKLQEKLPEKKFMDKISNICTMGFLVNMPKRTIQLITPTNPDKHNIAGMRVCDSVSFSDESSYEDGINSLIVKWMQPNIPLDVGFTTNTITEKKGYYLTFYGDKTKRTVTASDILYRVLISTLEGSTLRKSFEEFSVPDHEQGRVLELMQMFYDCGYIDIATK